MISAANSRGGERLVILFTAAWTIVLAAACAFHNGRFFHDDAYITLRYARHLIDGFGPVWNTAGPRVEGFTSPLHMLLIAGLGALHVPLKAAAHGVNFTFHLILIVGVWLWLRRVSGTFAAWTGAAMVAAAWPLLVWDFGGLDAVPFAALLTLGVLTSLRYFEGGERQHLLLGGVLLGLALFMRPEALGPACIVFAAAALFAPSPTRLRDAAMAALCCAAIALPWEFFRLTYYHAALPNTFYAKVYGIPLAFRLDRGWKFWKALLHVPPYLPELSLLSFAASAAKHRATRRDVVMAATIAVLVFSIYITGGDYMAAYRPFCDVLPLMVALLMRSLAAVGLFQTAPKAFAVSAVLALLAALQIHRFDINPVSEPAELLGKRQGSFIADRWPAGALVAINFAGSLPYEADRYTYVDMLGLNDRTIARRAPMPIGPIDGPTTRQLGHLKGDGTYVLGLHPDLVILGGGILAGSRYEVHLYGDWEMLHDSRFADYKACRINVPGESGAAASPLFIYQRRDLTWPCDPPTPSDWIYWGATPSPIDISQTQPQGT